MKKLSLNEMEMVNGGIYCYEIFYVLDYLMQTGHEDQVRAILNMENIQCTHIL